MKRILCTTFIVSIFFLLSFSSFSATSTSSLRPLTVQEGNEDFDFLLNLFQSNYGPYNYKEAGLGIKISDTWSNLKTLAAHSKSDEEFAGLVMRFGATLKDGHVQIRVENTSSGIAAYTLPLLVTPIEHRAIVGDIDPKLAVETGFAVGDEVLEVDGKPTMSYLPTILKYRSWARDASNEHFIYALFSRPSYMTDLTPTASTVRIKVKSMSGDLKIVDVPWVVRKYNPDADKLVPKSFAPVDLRIGYADELNGVTGHIKQMGAVTPYFVTAATQQAFKFVKVYPSDEVRAKFGLALKETPPIYAALYRAQNKTVLLVRIATYSPSDFSTDVYMKAYQALMYQYRDLADVLVLDQDHNPGGSYCAEFYDLFAQSGDVQSVELLRADRKWINDLKINYAGSPSEIGTWEGLDLLAVAQNVEKAYDAGRFFSDPQPLFQGSFFSKKRQFAWDKPMLVLIDELAGSCGDMFPMLVKANAHAKLFGQTTMGLGGNVEEVGVLPNSRIHIVLTRGLFYPYNPSRDPLPSEFIENNGVAPDYVFTNSIADFRAGYLNYVSAFTAKALEQVK
jgi:hypothetical protein